LKNIDVKKVIPSSGSAFLFFFMPPFNKKAGTVDKKKPGYHNTKKNGLVSDGLQLTGRPDHPDQKIPGWSDKEKHGIPESSKTVFHGDSVRLDRRKLAGQS
jgi:hypothetical protein